MRQSVACGKSGVTIIEMLIAAAIMTIIIGSIYGAFRAGNQASVSVEEYADLQQTGRVLLTRISSELRSIYNRAGQQGSNIQGENAQSAGNPPHFDKLTFTTTSHVPVNPTAAHGDVCTVTYTAECTREGAPLGLFMTEDLTPAMHPADFDPTSIKEIQITDLVIGMDCTYLDPSSDEWKTEWVNQTALPSAVHVQLTLRAAREAAVPITVSVTVALPAWANTQTGGTIPAAGAPSGARTTGGGAAQPPGRSSGG